MDQGLHSDAGGAEEMWSGCLSNHMMSAAFTHFFNLAHGSCFLSLSKVKENGGQKTHTPTNYLQLSSIILLS